MRKKRKQKKQKRKQKKQKRNRKKQKRKQKKQKRKDKSKKRKKVTTDCKRKLILHAKKVKGLRKKIWRYCDFFFP